jgi:hypothetical protein
MCNHTGEDLWPMTMFYRVRCKKPSSRRWSMLMIQTGWDAIGDEVEKGIQGRRWHSDAREFYGPEADDV